MAENVGGIFYSVDIETQDALAAQKQLDRGFDSMQKSMGETDRAAKQLGGGLTALAKSLAGLASAAAIAAEFRKAVDVTRQFNASISNLSALTGATGEDLEFLRQTALDFGRTTTLSASQAAEALKLVASAKPDLLESGEALRTVTKEAVTLAEAAGIDLPQAAGALTTTLNQFQLGAEESARVINVLAAGAKEGSSEIAQTVEVLKNAGVVAAQSGLSIEEFNGAVQALAKGAITGAEAGTGLRNVLTILNTQTDSRLRPSVVGLTQALANLEATGLDDVQMVKLFGRENLTAAKVLLQFRGEADRVTRAITGTTEAYRQASTNTNNLDGDTKALTSAYEALQITVGSLADDTLRDLTQSLTAVLSSLAENKDAISSFFSVAGIAAQSFAAVVVGKVIMAMTGYTAALVANAKASLTARTSAIGFSSAVGASVAPLTASRIAMNAATGAARGLSAAMALLGGPAGVIILAALAINEFAAKNETAEDRARELDTAVKGLTQSFKEMSAAQLNAKLAEFAVEAAELEGQIERLQAKQKQANKEFTETSGILGGSATSISQYSKATQDLAEQDTEGLDLTQRLEANRLAADAARKAIEDLKTASATPPSAPTVTGTPVNIGETGGSAGSKEASRIKKEAQELADLRAEEEQRARREAREKMAAQQEMLGQADPLVGEQQRFQTELANLRTLNEAKLLEDQRYLELKAQAEAAHTEQMRVLREQDFAAQSATNQLLLDSLNRVQEGATDAFVGLLTGANNSREAVQQLAQAILKDAVGALVKMGIEQVKLFVMGQTQQAASAATAAGTGAAMAASYAPAAAAASVASFGGAAGAGLAALASAIPAAIGLFSGRALGGPVQANQMYRVNETGAPEIFNAANGRQYMMPNQRGEVVSNNDATSGGGGSNVIINITNNTGAPVSQTETQMDDQRVIDIVVGDMMGDGRIAQATNRITGTRRAGQ